MINEIEKRFKEITFLTEMDLSKYPIKRSDYTDQQQKTSKEAAKERGYITTPIFLVDTMIAMKYSELTPDLRTCDLCAGEAGQFTVRLMRMLKNKFPDMDINSWLENNHTLVELDLASCAKLVYIYGSKINLWVGDAKEIGTVPDDAKGIYFYNGKTWKTNSIINQLLEIPLVNSNQELLNFIFLHNTETSKLQALLDKCKNLV
jgi:hypothetical protein